MMNVCDILQMKRMERRLIYFQKSTFTLKTFRLISTILGGFTKLIM